MFHQVLGLHVVNRSARVRHEVGEVVQDGVHDHLLVPRSVRGLARDGRVDLLLVYLQE